MTVKRLINLLSTLPEASDVQIGLALDVNKDYCRSLTGGVYGDVQEVGQRFVFERMDGDDLEVIKVVLRG